MGFLESTGGIIVIDIFIAAIALIIALIKAKSGLFNCFMPAVVIIMALAFGIVVSNLFSPWAISKVWPIVEDNVMTNFDERVERITSGIETPGQVFQNKWNHLLESQGYPQAKIESIDYSDAQAVKDAREALYETTKYATEQLVRWMILGLFAAIGLFVFTYLKNLLEKVTDIPGLHLLNRVGGLIVGAAEGILIVFVGLLIFKLVAHDQYMTFAESSYVIQFFTGKYF